MLPRSHRVSKKLFDDVLKSSRVSQGSFLSIRAGKSGDEQSRFAVVVSKKISNKATKRNSIRRKVYGAAAQLLPKVKASIVVLIFMKRGCENLTQKEIGTELEKVLNQAGLGSFL